MSNIKSLGARNTPLRKWSWNWELKQEGEGWTRQKLERVGGTGSSACKVPGAGGNQPGLRALRGTDGAETEGLPSVPPWNLAYQCLLLAPLLLCSSHTAPQEGTLCQGSLTNIHPFWGFTQTCPSLYSTLPGTLFPSKPPLPPHTPSHFLPYFLLEGERGRERMNK